jgi:DNA-directed RNA polymerase subunit RPC12/RpoP
MADVNFYCPQCGRALQADGSSAGTQVQCPQCGNAVAVPQWTSVPGASPGASGRPTSVTVFGILGIVFGGLGLACAPVGLIATFVGPGRASPLSSVPGYMAWAVISSLIGMAAAGWLLAVGIGLLGLKRWARSGAIAYGWFAIVFGILSTIITIMLLLSGGGSSTPEAVGGYVGGTCGGLIGLVFPILLLIFMTKPHVIAACDR